MEIKELLIDNGTEKIYSTDKSEEIVVEFQDNIVSVMAHLINE